MRRSTATVVIFSGCWALSIICCLSGEIFDFCDRVTSDFMMTFGSLLFVVFVGWKLKKSEVLEELPKPIYFFIHWVVPVLIVAIFVSNLILKG